MLAITEYVKEGVGQGELAIYEAFGAGIAANYNKGFSTLVLPEPIDIDAKNGKLRMPYYQGETFNDTWDVSNGGFPMGMRLAKVMPAVLKDLARIDPALITADKALAEIPDLAFDHHKAERYFRGLADRLKDQKLLSDEDCDKIAQLLAFEQTTTPIVNNGDFYPRNLIRTADGKIVLIDWETWNNNSPFYIVDHPENVAAVAYVHMWGNPKWQAAYRTEIDKVFGFSEKGFNKGVAIKAITLASFFPKHKELLKGQLEIIKTLS